MSSPSSTLEPATEFESDPSMDYPEEDDVSQTVMETIRDKTFYMSFIVFKVENVLFKVPQRAFWEHSDVFRAMFTLPPGSQTDIDGLSDERPLLLEGIKVEDFRSFLKALYPPCIGEALQLTEPEWASVLALAHMWSFQRIRKLAIDELANCAVDEIRKVELAHRFDIEEWYLAAYTALVRRERPLSFEEAHRLGFDFACKMQRVREDILKGMVLGNSPVGYPGGGPGWHRRRAKGGGPWSGRDFDLPSGHSSASSAAGVPEISVLQGADESAIETALAETFGVKRMHRRNDVNNSRRALQFSNSSFPIDFVLSMPELDSSELL